MAPRIVESDDEDDYHDELGSDYSDQGGKAAAKAKVPSKAKARAVPARAAASNAAASTSAASASPGPSSRTPSTRIRVNPGGNSAGKAQTPAAPAEVASPAPSATRGKRQAAIKANATMDVDGAMSSDQAYDEPGYPAAQQYSHEHVGSVQYAEEDAEGDEDDEDDDDDDDEDAEGEEEDELEDSDDYSMQTEAPAATASAGTTKIRLKFGGSGQASSPAPLPNPTIVSLKTGGSKAKAKSSAKGGAKKGKQAATAPAGKGKRKHTEMEEFDETLNDYEEEEDDLGSDDQGLGAEYDDEDDFLSDKSEGSNVSMTNMTARQRAAHIGAEPELLALPDAPSKKKILTADEVAMRKVETSRRRKHLLNKKLEEEKAETIERLLKKPVGGRRAAASTSRLAAQTKVERPIEDSPMVLPIQGGVDENGQVIPPEQMQELLQQRAPRIPTSYRWVSSIRNGEYREIWAVPTSLEERFNWPPNLPKVHEVLMKEDTPAKQVVYPPPRPPPTTRMLKRPESAAVAVA